MMLVVVVVTSATLYLAGKNLRAKQQETLETQFQNEVRSYLALQESRLSGINEKCKAFSHSVRIRAALEERDIDDLYRNALTELRDILGPSDDNARISSETIRASFVRFLDPAGGVLPPNGQPIPIVDQPGVDPALEAAGAALRSAGQQSSGFIALNSERQLSTLRQIVVTKILNWNGAELGAIVRGFPVQALQVGDEIRVISRRHFLQPRNLRHGMSPFDQGALTKRMNVSIELPIDQFWSNWKPDRNYFFTKRSTPPPDCIPPMVASPTRRCHAEIQALRWKIITFGTCILCADSLSAFFSLEDWPKPVDPIVAGSVENFARRQEADKISPPIRVEKALSELKATQRQMIQQERLRALGKWRAASHTILIIRSLLSSASAKFC